MKDFTYCVTFPDGKQKNETVEATDVIKGQWKIYKKYEGQIVKVYWVKTEKKITISN